MPRHNDGLAEPELLIGPGGDFLFLIALQSSGHNFIAVAHSNSLSGPWAVNPAPSITRGYASAFDEDQVVAPSVIIEGNTVRMWFSGFTPGGLIAIGYAEAPWPLVR